ncbi:MAG TPA: hypothetical protein VJM53_03190 [Burkholderiales bacterium]|jgi:hypothetical protein|nr:hypothetical protein [Burkholderiales bacterium]
MQFGPFEQNVIRHMVEYAHANQQDIAAGSQTTRIAGFAFWEYAQGTAETVNAIFGKRAMDAVQAVMRELLDILDPLWKEHARERMKGAPVDVVSHLGPPGETPLAGPVAVLLRQLKIFETFGCKIHFSASTPKARKLIALKLSAALNGCDASVGYPDEWSKVVEMIERDNAWPSGLNSMLERIVDDAIELDRAFGDL